MGGESDESIEEFAESFASRRSASSVAAFVSRFVAFVSSCESALVATAMSRPRLYGFCGPNVQTKGWMEA